MRQTIVAAAILLVAASSTGCRIDTDKHGDGDNVKIATPFGGMSVKTNQTDTLAGIGLPPYPGAVLVKKQKEDKDKKDEDGAPLIDKILDTAGQKGTGKWTAVNALDLGMPVTLIGEAVFARCLSAMKDERVAASQILKGPNAWPAPRGSSRRSS